MRIPTALPIMSAVVLSEKQERFVFPPLCRPLLVCHRHPLARQFPPSHQWG